MKVAADLVSVENSLPGSSIAVGLLCAHIQCVLGAGTWCDRIEEKTEEEMGREREPFGVFFFMTLILEDQGLTLKTSFSLIASLLQIQSHCFGLHHGNLGRGTHNLAHNMQ